MPINFHYDPDVGILFTSAEGLLTLDEILRHLNEERNAKGIAHPEVFDATQARTDATAEQVRVVPATHEIAAQLAAYAARRRFASVEYDDTERSYCPDFPYFRLASLIAEKLDARGIAFNASGPVSSETAEPLAEA